MENQPANRDESRNPDGTFKPGFSGNPSGRPKGTMKDYLRRKFMEMTDDEKREWIRDNKISGIDQIKLAEGNPAQDVGLEAKGEININLIKYGDYNSSLIQPKRLPDPDIIQSSEIQCDSSS